MLIQIIINYFIIVYYLFSNEFNKLIKFILILILYYY